MEREEGTLPGDPRGMWKRESSRRTSPARWLPNALDLPPWRTPDELHRNYSVVPMWWQRWVLPMIAAFLNVIILPSAWLSPPDPATFRGGTTVVATVVLLVLLVVIVIRQVLHEVTFHRRRAEDVQECFALLQQTAVPVWAVFANRVRVSGGGDSVYDLQFVFDLRTPAETLRLQHRVVEAWLDEIVAKDDTLPQDFARFDPVHGADVFGEGMRGVWIWDKGAILPIQVLGLSVEDPQTASRLSARNVAFMRRQPKDLRDRSKIARRNGGS